MYQKRYTINPWLIVFFFSVTAFQCWSGIGWCDIYKYVDVNGVIHFTNTPTGSEFHFYLKETPGIGLEKQSISELIARYARTFNLEEALIKAVIKVESDYDPKAVSSKGAQGMMQLIPETAREMNVGDPFNPEENIRGGSHYLRKMLDEFGGNLELALAAYNAGPGSVRRHGGIPPFEETRQYIERVKKYLDQYR
jgi:soluble lytic murein transglycosylase-like protein